MTSTWTSTRQESSEQESSDAGTPGSPSRDVSRAKWASQVEFLLSCLSYAVGLGNIWRFPYLCFENGGGAFLIPYVLMLFLCGLPLFFFELSLGQFASLGPVAVWAVCPLFQGIGYAMLVISIFIGIYYNVIISWAIFYLVSSFGSHLPWSGCDNAWNTQACRSDVVTECMLKGGLMNASGGAEMVGEGVCVTKDQVDETVWSALNSSRKAAHLTPSMPADEFFRNHMLDRSGGIEELGTLRWPLVLCLLAAWLLVFLALVRGVKSFGKAVYFTATFPYAILLILLVRAATLPGYVNGITFYLTPNWQKLTEIKVWAEAAIQIFFSLSPCWGGLITLASFNRFHNNHFRDALVVTAANSLTSFFAGFVIFGIVGFMAHELGVEVKDVVDEGPGLAFIAYPEAVSRLPLSPLWSILFFSMLITLGMGTQLTIMETVVSTLVDFRPHVLRHRHRWVLFASCVVMFLCGLPMCTQGGFYVLTMMDKYAGSFSALLVGTTEVLVIAWVYGVDRFLDDIRVMLGHYPFHYQWWKWTWKVFTPLLLISLVVSSFINHTPLKTGDIVFPDWSNSLGWSISLASVAMIPLFIIFRIAGRGGVIGDEHGGVRNLSTMSLLQRVKALTVPDARWGPALDEHRMEAHRPKHFAGCRETDKQHQHTVLHLTASTTDADPTAEDQSDANLPVQMSPLAPPSSSTEPRV